MKAAVCDSVAARDMIAVVGELFTRSEPRRISDDLIAFNHQLAAVGVSDHPFATEQCHRPIRRVRDRDEVNKGVRLVLRQRGAAVMIREFVELGGQPGNFTGTT